MSDLLARKTIKRKRDEKEANLDSCGHRIGKEQMLSAATALLKYIKEKDETSNKNVLLTEASRVLVSIQLMQSLPGRQSKLKHRATLPHPLYTRDDQEVCLITTAPQSKWKEVVRPEESLSNIKKVIDMNKLRKKYKSFEAKRRLATGFNAFLCDQAVVPFLPKLLGETFFARNKEPLHVDMAKAPKSLEKALNCTHYSIQDNSCFSVMIATTDFSAEEIAENAFAALDQIVSSRLPSDWRDVQSISLKGIDTPALPLYAHNYAETSKKAATKYQFPKRIRLELPDLPEEPKSTWKGKAAEDDENSEMEQEDGRVEGAAESDDEEGDVLSDLSGVEDEDSEE